MPRNPSILCRSSPVLVILCFLFSAAVGRADAMLLETIGPKSGSICSNPALLEENSRSRIAMEAADVIIHVHGGVGDELSASCSATFTLHRYAGVNGDDEDCVLAFPVTGLSSKVVTIGNFEATLDGGRPLEVSRHMVFVAPPGGLWDCTIAASGQLDGGLYPYSRDPRRGHGIMSAVYPDAYVWHQRFRAGATAIVRIRYTARLRPQEVRYSKAYLHRIDSETIPFDGNPASDWSRKYYFFDYVLLSGSTWYGPIGREEIELSVDPNLTRSLGSIETGLRQPYGVPAFGSRTEALGTSYSQTIPPEGEIGCSVRWKITGKPTSDLIFAIPKR